MGYWLFGFSGALGGLAILTKTELLLVILGGIYVLEALSVILQVLYLNYTKGRRLFFNWHPSITILN